MTICQLILRDAKWIAINSDKTTTKNYNKINRDNLTSFELKYKKRNLITSESLVFKLDTKGKTLIHRLKTQAKSKHTSQIYMQNPQSKLKLAQKLKSIVIPLTQYKRVRITALLQRNQDPTKNKYYNNYSFDPELSEIHYIFEDGTKQKRNDFGNRSPYLPLELFPEELEHLMKGV